MFSNEKSLNLKRLFFFKMHILSVYEYFLFFPVILKRKCCTLFFSSIFNLLLLLERVALRGKYKKREGE